MTGHRIDLTEVVGRQADDLVAEALAEARDLARADLVGLLRQAIVDRAIDDLARPGKSEPANDEPANDQDHSDDRGLYVYAITSAQGVDLTDVPAIDPGTCPDLVTHNGIALVVSDVDLAVLRSLPTDDLTETSTLATLVRRHDEVIRAVFAQAPVLPLRFGTVVTDRVAATELLAHHHREATELLDRVAGRREWGVRLHIEEDTGNDSGQTEGQPESENPDDPPASGTEYLARRRTALTVRENRGRARQAALDSAHTALGRTADDCTTRGSSGQSVLLDVAYLVGTAHEDTFFAEVDRQRQAMREQGITLDVTGPWPPYSFVRTGLLEATAGA